MIIAKFGGTSLENLAAMNRSAAIIAARPQTGVCVVSATAGTTNDLLAIVEQARTGRHDATSVQLMALHKRHRALADEVGLSIPERAALEEVLGRIDTLSQGIALLGEATARSRDQLVSQGEVLAGILFTRALHNAGVRAQGFDARRVVRTDDRFGRAEPQPAQIRLLARQHLVPMLEDVVVVTQGFTGATGEGHTTTLGRGGSDYSAALLGEALDAEVVHIWTDVPGIATTDPGLLAGTRTIPELGFSEAAELAVFGAKVLHPATLWPAIRSGIPVYIGSSREPEAGGTWVRPDHEHDPPGARAIALRRNQQLITLTSLRMLHSPGFLARVFGILAEHEISVDMLTTSEISVSLTLDQPVRLTPAVLAALGAVARVSVEEDLALIALVGRGFNEAGAFTARIFAHLGQIPVRLICQGASDRSIGLLVPDRCAREAVRRLHDGLLVEEVAPCVSL